MYMCSDTWKNAVINFIKQGRIHGRTWSEEWDRK